MSKTTNRRENYISRSKLVANFENDLKSDDNKECRREEFIVDKNGYFFWAKSAVKT